MSNQSIKYGILLTKEQLDFLKCIFGNECHW